MEDFLTTAEEFQQSVARLNDLEQSLAEARTKLPDLRHALPELETAAAQAKQNLHRAEHPGPFRRLFPASDDKIESLRTAWRTAENAAAQAAQSIRDMETLLDQGPQELEPLRARKIQYLQFLEEHLDLHPQARPLLLRQYAQDAIGVSFAMSAVLQQSRGGMSRDVRTTRVSPEDRKLAILAEADRLAGEFCRLVDKLPEGTLTLGLSLRHPSAYITGATNPHAQLDRMNHVLDFARNARVRLREFLDAQ